MNLKAFRKFLVTQAGRYDLVNDDFSDNGIDSFIIAGSKYLDNLNEIQKSSDTLIEKSKEGTEKIESGYNLSHHSSTISLSHRRKGKRTSRYTRTCDPARLQ